MKCKFQNYLTKYPDNGKIYLKYVIRIIFSYSRWVEKKGSLKELGAGRKKHVKCLIP